MSRIEADIAKIQFPTESSSIPRYQRSAEPKIRPNPDFQWPEADFRKWRVGHRGLLIINMVKNCTEYHTASVSLPHSASKGTLVDPDLVRSYELEA